MRKAFVANKKKKNRLCFSIYECNIADTSERLKISNRNAEYSSIFLSAGGEQQKKLFDGFDAQSDLPVNVRLPLKSVCINVAHLKKITFNT